MIIKKHKIEKQVLNVLDRYERENHNFMLVQKIIYNGGDIVLVFNSYSSHLMATGMLK